MHLPGQFRDSSGVAAHRSVARGLLGRMEFHLVSVESSNLLKSLHSAALQYELFSASLHALRELADITITNKMLEGW